MYIRSTFLPRHTGFPYAEPCDFDGKFPLYTRKVWVAKMRRKLYNADHNSSNLKGWECSIESTGAGFDAWDFDPHHGLRSGKRHCLPVNRG
jgi:hypothetical protein